MKKRFSKIAFLLVLIFVPVIVTFGFSACSCSDKPDPEPPANVAVVTINRESASVPEYETIMLAALSPLTAVNVRGISVFLPLSVVVDSVAA